MKLTSVSICTLVAILRRRGVAGPKGGRIVVRTSEETERMRDLQGLKERRSQWLAFDTEDRKMTLRNLTLTRRNLAVI